MPNLVAMDVGELTSAADLFRCVPLSAVIAARVCLARQAKHGERVSMSSAGRMQPGRAVKYAYVKRNFGRCCDCELGKRVAESVGGGT